MSFFKDHSLLILLSLAGVFAFVWFLPFRKRLRMGTVKLLIVTTILMFWGFAAARWVFPFIEAFGNVQEMANLRMYGIFFFDWIGILIVTKIIKTDRPLFFDICAVSMVVCALLGRMDCFVKGCCYGVPFFGHSFRWPIREIELIANLLLLAYFIPKILKGKTHGQVYPVCLIYYGMVRFILECFRVEGTPIGSNGFHLAHIWSAISVLMGIFGLLILSEKQKREKQKKRAMVK